MKSNDQLLLEQAYSKIQATARENCVITEGSIFNSVKKLGTDAISGIKSYLLDPNNYKLLTTTMKVAAPLMFAIATGNYAAAADAMADVFTPEDWSKVMDQAKTIFASGNEEAKEKFLSAINDYYVNGLSDSIGKENSRQAMETISDQYLEVAKAQLANSTNNLNKLTK